jgi:hypothetical protein
MEFSGYTDWIIKTQGISKRFYCANPECSRLSAVHRNLSRNLKHLAIQSKKAMRRDYPHQSSDAQSQFRVLYFWQ